MLHHSAFDGTGDSILWKITDHQWLKGESNSDLLKCECEKVL